MKHIWLYLSRKDIETERRQCEDEGRDLSSLEDEFARVLALDLEDPKNQGAAQALLDKTIALPLRAEYSFHEPDDLNSIRAARPKKRAPLPVLKLSDSELLDKIHGAWTARVAGCLLGKPIEGWNLSRVREYSLRQNNWPLATYLNSENFKENKTASYAEGNNLGAWADMMQSRAPRGMPEDDDTNYTTIGLAILKRFGPNFSPTDVANFWLSDVPILHTCTAERVAYRNFCNLIAPPHSARFRNPYREWIGAQIRADFWGYCNPGNPQRAAEFAWRDASISHVKNGIYGEMWCAAMIAASFIETDAARVIGIGLNEIPEHCRLASDVKRVLAWRHEGLSYDAALQKIHAAWDEANPHDWCHTISNAMIVALGLLWGERDFSKTICRAVQGCFDTDCNGATVGSIVGIWNGRQNLPDEWTRIFDDKLITGVAGYHLVELEDMARETLQLVEQAGA